MVKQRNETNLLGAADGKVADKHSPVLLQALLRLAGLQPLSLHHPVLCVVLSARLGGLSLPLPVGFFWPVLILVCLL